MSGWRPSAGRERPERREAGERRSGKDRRAPVSPPPTPEDARRIVKPSPRQLEVLALIASGKRAKEIGKMLGLSEHTVSSHADAARHRLCADNLPQAVAEAIAWGWLVSQRRRSSTARRVR